MGVTQIHHFRDTEEEDEVEVGHTTLLYLYVVEAWEGDPRREVVVHLFHHHQSQLSWEEVEEVVHYEEVCLLVPHSCQMEQVVHLYQKINKIFVYNHEVMTLYLLCRLHKLVSLCRFVFTLPV